VGQRADGPAPAADDPDMIALRAFAAEVVIAAGGLPSGSAYRPRLEPGRPLAAAMPEGARLADVGREIAARLRWRPRHPVALALAGVGAMGGALLLGWVLVPGEADLQLAGARPATVAIAPTPPPPPPLPLTDTRIVPPPPAATRPLAAPPAPMAARPAPPPTPPRPPVANTIARREPPAAKKTVTRRVARATVTRRGSAPSAAPTTPGKKDRSASAHDPRAMIAGMEAIQPLVKDCYRRYRQKGVANVRIDVGSAGKVKRVQIAGPLARTKSAACLKAAVMTARFGQSGISFQYPLVLR
jgi:hypothetical protein